ncbi:sigma-70 family RNA polymerase sigma factor [Sporichthya sp.]|uniref:sigma-70 family RNA polymerase sigma factor n=1 Tax=Sporichthya sp. TaxID=65475 RepID=UPI0017DD8407|nr:sigma-70 family RNA polymerase sigma factor [Sporichthya sp.]MBA3741783.1 sigma-70 family RNA polymerase sigma factor [Sporichthya sp.]
MSERPAGLRAVRDVPAEDQAPERLEDLMVRVAKGDNAAYEAVFTRVSGPVYGLIRRVLRDPAQSEEVSQEVLVTVWRNASRFDENQGSAMAWIMTMAHRRAVDRVRSEQAATERVRKLAPRTYEPAYDDVSESVEIRLEKEAVRRCLGSLTELQRESVGLAYYGGYTYREVGELLDVPLGTVKTRMRDGLIRLRDCLGVTA